MGPIHRSVLSIQKSFLFVCVLTFTHLGLVKTKVTGLHYSARQLCDFSGSQTGDIHQRRIFQWAGQHLMKVSVAFTKILSPFLLTLAMINFLSSLHNLITVMFIFHFLISTYVQHIPLIVFLESGYVCM